MILSVLLLLCKPGASLDVSTPCLLPIDSGEVIRDPSASLSDSSSFAAPLFGAHAITNTPIKVVVTPYRNARV